MNFKLEGETHGIDAKFEYKSDGDSTKITSKFRSKIYSVVEFVDNDPAGFDSGDTIVQTYNMGDGKYISTAGTVAGKDAASVASTVSTTSISTEDGHFTARVYYSDKLVTFDQQVGGTDVEQEVSMASLKMDFIIQDFPYQQNDTKLAFEGRFKSKEKVKNDGERSIVTKIDTGDGVEESVGFSFLTDVDVDGEKVSLIQSAGGAPETAGADKESGEEEFQKYFTVDKVGKHTKITWDPVVGFEASSSALLAPLSLLVMFYLF